MRRALVALLLVGAALGASACASTSNEAMNRSLSPLPSTPQSTSAATSTTTPDTTCNPVQSFAPDGTTTGPGLDKIRSNGVLVVGVDQGTTGWGYRDPRTGELKGLEVDLLEKIAGAILGDESKIKFKTVTTAQRIAAVQRGDVDMVASLLTATCARWRDVDFSTVYYDAHQDVMVNENSDITNVDDLAGRTVCATRGSTSIVNIAARVPKAILYPVDTRSDCLVALQEGEVDAITSDDTILRSFQAQERVLHTRLLGPISEGEHEPYAIAMKQGNEDLVRFVNGVLQQMRDDRTLEQLYVKWLGVNAPAAPPSAVTGR
jgi:polar amino acid transport system substrate-binding protein